MRQIDSTSLADVVLDASTLPSGLTRHDLGDGISVSFLYDGDEANPDTNQWRIVAPDRKQLREKVEGLVELLRARGVECKPAHFNGQVCKFRDRGPWKT